MEEVEFNKKNNITLIGMSGVGKSTLGRELADELTWDFIDTDIFIKNDFNQPLPDILLQLGEKKFKEKETEKILSLAHVENTVISPGGSVIYSRDSMRLLGDISTIIYLSITPEVLQSRVGKKDRGIVGLESKTFAELYRERIPLYRRYADIIININHKKSSVIIQELISKV